MYLEEFVIAKSAYCQNPPRRATPSGVIAEARNFPQRVIFREPSRFEFEALRDKLKVLVKTPAGDRRLLLFPLVMAVTRLIKDVRGPGGGPAQWNADLLHRSLGLEVTIDLAGKIVAAYEQGLAGTVATVKG